MLTSLPTLRALIMDFPARLAALRKTQGLTQQALAERAGISLIQVHRYESGSSQPTLDGIRKLARALAVSADTLVFDITERGAPDDLKLQFEALAHFDAEEKKIAKALLDSLILTHQARRWASAS